MGHYLSGALLVVVLMDPMLSFAQGADKNVSTEVTRDETGEFIIAVSGLSNQHREAIVENSVPVTFKVWVEGVNHNEIPPLLGETGLNEKYLYFKPQFPFKPGMKFDAQISIAIDPPLFVAKTVSTPTFTHRPTKIEAFYPSAAELPENLLKFYVHFSSPMRKGDVYRYIKIRERIRTNGKLSYREVELPFLEIEQEFWSSDSTRLTLLLDPGRIKRGLKPRRDMGPIFEAGRDYELVIDSAWPDAKGVPLKAGLPVEQSEFVNKIFRATQADRQCPQPKSWKLEIPQSGSKNSLVIGLDEPLDSAMLRRVITVRGPDDRTIGGDVQLLDHESVWKLTPEANWRTGKHIIHVDNRLEDLCGNSVSKLFDVDVFEKNEPPGSDGKTVLQFEIK